MLLAQVRNGQTRRLSRMIYCTKLLDEVLLHLLTPGDISPDIWHEKSLDAKILDPVHTAVWTVYYYCVVFFMLS